MSISRLAKILAMDRTTLGRNLKPLDDQGLVKFFQGKDLRLRMATLLTESDHRADF